MPVAREYRSLEEARRALGSDLRPGDGAALFDRFDWFAALHRHCFADAPVSIIHASEGGAAAWLFLVEGAARRASALANWYSFRWAPVVTGAPDATTRAALLEAAATALLRERAHVDFYPMEADGAWLAALRHAGWFAVARPMGGRHMLDVAGRSFAEYWAGRPGQLRSLVKRKGRGDPFALSVHGELTDVLWADYVDVHARSWKEVEPEGGLPFLREIASREAEAGRLRLGFARAGGLAVAAQLWTIDGTSALIHKLNHDRAFNAQSPGTLLSHAMFARAIDGDRVETIDYGTGDNPYKVDWMERRVALHRIDAFNPRHASAWLPAARAAISALVG